jgi:subtilisin family serine protease
MMSSAIASIETTGRYLVLLPEEDIDAGIRALSDSIGNIGVARSGDFVANSFSAEELESPRASVFDSLGVASISLDSDQIRSLETAATNNSSILAVEPERIVYALGDDQFNGLSFDYLKGYRDAINHLVDRALPATPANISATAVAENASTWGLQVTRVLESRFTGQGIRVAVLDTGFDINHPDFAGRQITSKSFIVGEDAQDVNGHGTHCIGTACGSNSPPTVPPRYGVAYNAEIFAGKVLSNRGSGGDQGILAGIEWAVASRCQVISMSLGAGTRPGDTYSRIYERAAQRALRNQTLIIAAAGNESDRRAGQINPVGYPANCPSIMAVGAITDQMGISFFSTRSINPNGGEVDIVAPGGNIFDSQIYSSWPMPKRYNRISGTSMATPHVAGIAALYAEASGQTGRALWNLLVNNAKRLPLPPIDAGVGLVQAPI